MKLPQPLLENVCFIFDDVEDFIQALQSENPQEPDEIKRLVGLGLPPVTSIDAVAVAFGYNPGFVNSMRASIKSHYRFFSIPKGKEDRNIVAPKVALKGIQKWLSVHFQRKYDAPETVYGFVPGRSHLDAAGKHLGANWICSVDIENFFPSVWRGRMDQAFRFLGYQSDVSIELLTRLCGIRGALVQGSPASPVISNVVLRGLDASLSEYARANNCMVTRYADDIVVSGEGDPPDDVLTKLEKIVTDDGWNVSRRKSSLAVSPERLKVHGLLVHGDRVRLTKGYRNRIRAYRHLLARGQVSDEDVAKIAGHIMYSDQVEKHGE